MNTNSFRKLENPPCLKFYRKVLIDQICYFLYQEKQPAIQYENWLNNLIAYTPVKNGGCYFYTKWTIHQILHYVCINLGVRITILNKDFGIYFSSYFTHLANLAPQYVFIQEAHIGKRAVLYLSKEKILSPITSSVGPTQSLAAVEKILNEQYNTTAISLLNNHQEDPLKNVNTHVLILAADSMFTDDIQHLHCIANWGKAETTETLYVILIYTPNQEWTGIYNPPLRNPKSELSLPFKSSLVHRVIEYTESTRKIKLDETKCVCHGLQDYYNPNAKHKLFKPVGYKENKDLVTLLKILGLYNAKVEATLNTAIKLSIISYDIESLCIPKIDLPIKQIGVCIQNDNTYFNGQNSVQRQVPFIIGCTHFDILQVLKKHSPLSTHLKNFKKGTMKEENFIKSILLAKIPEADFYAHQKTELIHIKTNAKVNQHTEPDESNITCMIKQWLYYCYQQASLSKIVKKALLKKLMDKLNSLIQELVIAGDRRYSDVFTKALSKCEGLINESFLISFNGSNYDLPLCEKYFWNVQLECNFIMKIFKKSTSIPSINITINKWLNERVCKVLLTFKDARSLEEPSINLAMLGKKFNIDVSKGLFPHSLSVSIQTLKRTKQLPPSNSTAWFNILSNSKPSDVDINQAHIDYTDCGARNLYEYAMSYLRRDTQVLFEVFLKMLDVWNQAGINIILARQFTISSVVFKLFYIQNKVNNVLHIAPGKVEDPLANIIIDQAIVGGYTCAHAHGEIDKNFIINSHLNSFTYSPQSTAFPAFHTTGPYEYPTNHIIGLDIRSQYAHSSSLELPYGVPVVLQTVNVKCIEKKSFIDVVSFCEAVQNKPQSLKVQIINSHDKIWREEFYAVRHWLKTRILNQEVSINKYKVNLCYTAFSACGQINFNQFFVDAYVQLQKDSHTKILIFNYNGFPHGCKVTCNKKDGNKPENIQRRYASDAKHKILLTLIDIWNKTLQNTTIEVEVYDTCDFNHQGFPKEDALLKDIIPSQQTYSTFLKNIYQKKYEGFLVLKNLKLKPENCVPSMGFCIQRSCIQPASMYSPYMKATYASQKSIGPAVIGLNSFKGIKVIHSSYLLFLKEKFGFLEDPLILHAVLFRHAAYLKDDITYHLQLRQNIKQQLKNPQLSPDERSILESRSSEVKLKLNGTYGFTLLKTETMQTPYVQEKLYSAKNIQRLAKKPGVIGYEKMNSTSYKVISKSVAAFNFSESVTPLAAVGATILMYSKNILLDNIHFLLSHLDPHKAELLYLDTDSCYWAVHHKNLADNVASHMKKSYEQNKNSYIDSNNLLAGYLITEHVALQMSLYGEKMYKLQFESLETEIHLKSINKGLHKEFKNNSHSLYADAKTVIVQSGFRRLPGGGIDLVTETKRILNGVQPKKRFFIDSQHSCTY